jgi:putative GTP pyrophosphokinase
MPGFDAARGDVAAEYAALRPAYEAFSIVLDGLVRRLCVAADVKVQTVESRAKQVDHLVEKFARHPEYRTLLDATDLCGIRIVVFYASDVERVREIIRHEFEVIEDESRGAETADEFGYRSIHLLATLNPARAALSEYAPFSGMTFEIQIRTVLQHAWAVISHRLDYKTAQEAPAASRRKLFRIAALLETSDVLFGDFREEVEKVRREYRQVTTADEWAKLDLNLDSVVAAWTRLPTERVKSVALAAGFQPSVGDSADTRSIGNLVTVAAQAGLVTVGDLARLMTDVSSQASSLRRLAHEATDRGFSPLAEVPDVVTLCLLLENPRLRILASLPFRPEVEQALDTLQSAPS